jgi:hypothetical protein
MSLAGWVISVDDGVCGTRLHALFAPFAQVGLFDTRVFMKTKQHVDFSDHTVWTGVHALPASLAKVRIQPNEFCLIVTCAPLNSVATFHVLLLH